MSKNFIALVGIVIVLLGAYLFLSPKQKVTTISQDMNVTGNYAVAPGEQVVLKNGAKLNVSGDLTLGGQVTCDGGALNITVGGKAVINTSLNCVRSVNSSSNGEEMLLNTKPEELAQGINLVVAKDLTFGPEAVVASNGLVQLVSSADKLLTTQDQIDKAYASVLDDTATGKPRLGPLSEGKVTSFVPGQPMSYYDASTGGPIFFVNTAKAQTPRDDQGNAVQNVVIGGKWYVGDGGKPPAGLIIPKPPKGAHKIILNFNFGPGGHVQLKDFYLAGPSGENGKDDLNQSCLAHGTKGGDAMRFLVNAGSISLNNFTLELGNGGNGGNASTKKDCDPGVATGGDGGEAGNFKMMAENGITITSFHIIPGLAGGGGSADAFGKDGVPACPGKKGGDATATGGNGGPNKKKLSAEGAVTGIENITIDQVDGGTGGPATATPGKGGDGTGCKCDGGVGGKGTATGGKGGDASVQLPGGAGTANGGDGGNAASNGGLGGTGGSCNLVPTGGNGGKGGDAKSKEGDAGSGTTNPGTAGTVTSETGGNGGNGGDGCGPGAGGKGGIGKPNGTDGKPGKKACPEIKQNSVTTPPPQVNVTTGTTGVTPTPTPTNTTGTATPPTGTTSPTSGTTSGTSGTTLTPAPAQTRTIPAIEYNGKYLPLSQLITEDETGCGASHYHAANYVVKATDGSMVQDPGPQCGYGKVQDKPTMQVPAPAGN